MYKCHSMGNTNRKLLKGTTSIFITNHHQKKAEFTFVICFH